MGDLGETAEHHALNKGFTTLLVLILLSFIAGSGIDAHIRAGGVNRIVHREIQSRQALYAAEGGLEWAKYQLAMGGLEGKKTLEYGQGQVSISLERDKEGCWVTAEGKVGSSVRKIKAYIKNSSVHWQILYYQEVYL